MTFQALFKEFHQISSNIISTGNHVPNLSNNISEKIASIKLLLELDVVKEGENAPQRFFLYFFRLLTLKF